MAPPARPQGCGKLGFSACPGSLSLPQKLRYLLSPFHLRQIRKQENGIWGWELAGLSPGLLPVTGKHRAREGACIMASGFSSSFIHLFFKHMTGCLSRRPHGLESFISLKQIWSSDRNGVIGELIVGPNGAKKHCGLERGAGFMSLFKPFERFCLHVV